MCGGPAWAAPKLVLSKSGSRDWTGLFMLISLFLVFFLHFLFYSCGGLSWLSVNFLLHVKYALSYRIISYRIVSYRKRWHKPILHNARTLATVGTREERCRSKIILDRGRKVCPKRLQQTQTITATFSAIIFVYYGVLCYLHCCCTRWDR